MAKDLEEALTNIETKLGGSQKPHMDLGEHLEYIESLIGGGSGGSGIEDVKVNGTSVVEDGSANINLKTINDESIVGNSNIKLARSEVLEVEPGEPDPDHPERGYLSITEEDWDHLMTTRPEYLTVSMTMQGQEINHYEAIYAGYNPQIHELTYGITAMMLDPQLNYTVILKFTEETYEEAGEELTKKVGYL